jgi:NAD(P)-dependent dehydrogenase (short-subunit alcohol dehydrogenase family)
VRSRVRAGQRLDDAPAADHLDARRLNVYTHWCMDWGGLAGVTPILPRGLRRWRPPSRVESRRRRREGIIPRRSGVVVNASSAAGISGHPTENPHCVSKWAIIGFTEVLSIEGGKHDIRVNTISPGATRTEEFEQAIGALARTRGMDEEEMWKRLHVSNSLNGIAEPEEVARAVVFPASDDSSARTGHNMIVSCGFHVIHPQELHRL